MAGSALILLHFIAFIRETIFDPPPEINIAMRGFIRAFQNNLRRFHL